MTMFTFIILSSYTLIYSTAPKEWLNGCSFQSDKGLWKWPFIGSHTVQLSNLNYNSTSSSSTSFIRSCFWGCTGEEGGVLGTWKFLIMDQDLSFDGQYGPLSLSSMHLKVFRKKWMDLSAKGVQLILWHILYYI